MFLHRLKTEISENLRLLLPIWAMLAVVVALILQSWNRPMNVANTYSDELACILLLIIGIFTLVLIAKTFKRDDLKNPQDFWTTRPIRSLPIFGTKLVFLWLTVILPMGVCFTVTGLLIGVGAEAIWHGLEVMLWTGLPTNLVILGCLAHRGGGKPFLVPVAFIGTFVFVMTLLSIPFISNMIPKGIFPDVFVFLVNFISAAVFLTVLFGWMALQQIRKRHKPQKTWIFSALAIAAMLFVVYSPFPGKLITMYFLDNTQTLPTVTSGQTDWEDTRSMTNRDSGFYLNSIRVKIKELPHNNYTRVISSHLEFADDSGLELRNLSIRCTGIRSGGPTEGTHALDMHVSYGETLDKTMRTPSSQDRHRIKNVKDLPKREVRIKGNIVVRITDYKELFRTPIGVSATAEDGGMRSAYQPHTNRSAFDNDTLIIRSYSPPLISGLKVDGMDSVKVLLHHAKEGRITEVHSNYIGSADDGMIMQYACALHLHPQDIEKSGYWLQRQYEGDMPPVEEWLKDAELVIEAPLHSRIATIPIDMMVEIPDSE